MVAMGKVLPLPNPQSIFIECCREGQPEPPGSTGCSMALYISDYTGLNVFVVGVDNLLRDYT